MSKEQTQRAIEAVWRIESPKLIAGLARFVGDVGLAEDIAQEALIAAMTAWPVSGVPRNPAAWLTAAAKRRAIDAFRHRRMAAEKHLQVGADLALDRELAAEDAEAALLDALDDDLGDNMLGLIFTACHPVLSPEARAALTLRMLGGLTTQEIARAFLVPEPTIAQRIVRAKKTLESSGVGFAVPRGPERLARLPSVLEVIYLIFNEGYSATSGENLLRPELCEDALRLGRVLAGLMPEEAEVHGLVALMEIQASRLSARLTASGAPVLLMDQDRRRWDRLLIRRGLAALSRAESLAGPPGPYRLQAAIAACHARAQRPEDTDWVRIAALYAALMQATPSPVIELNRAVALGMALGPEAGLAVVDDLVAEKSLAGYHLLWATRADLLERLGRKAEARENFARAAALTHNGRERALLNARAAACGD